MANTSTLCGAKLTRAELATVETREPMGKIHQPVPHIELVESITGAFEERGLRITREELALNADGDNLFGVMDLVPANGSPLDGVIEGEGRGFSVGFRSSNRQNFSIGMVGGERVFVCSNLIFSGDVILLKRKHTNQIDLHMEVVDAVDRFIGAAPALEEGIHDLEVKVLDDPDAKKMAFDIFADGILPLRLLPAVASNYFEATVAETPDCVPRTQLGLHNACSRAVRTMRPEPKFRATSSLGRFFGLCERQ